MLWFVAQTGVLHDTIAERVDAYPFSSGYLDKAYNMAKHMMVVSRYFVPRTIKGAHISTPHIKTFVVRFLGKYSMNQFRFKLILILVIFPSHWCHHKCCLFCSWCELKTQIFRKKCPRWQNNASVFLGVELFTFTSQARPQFRFCS